MKSKTVKTILTNLVVSVGLTLGAAAMAADKNRAVETNAPPKVALPRLVDFGADKCIPCKMMIPILADLRTNYVGQLEVEFIDVWKNPKAGKEYKINIIPTQIFYDAKGRELFRHEGLLSKEDVLAKWKELGVKLTSRARDAEREAQAPKPR